MRYVRCPTLLIAVTCLAAGIGAQGGVQKFDHPETGGLSPRNANYDIDVSLDAAARTLTGRETIRWRNISANPTRELQFHLYWNAWRNAESTWLRERRLAGSTATPRRDAWGSIDVTRIALTPSPAIGTPAEVDLRTQMRFIAPDDGNGEDRTVMSVALPNEVQPNETIQIELTWTAAIPRPFARTGYVDDYYFIAQWFPKLGVLEDRGWNTHQFHAATEFYSDYGVYDVRITVPRGYVVGASGKETSAPEASEGTAVHRYHGEDIHDFAWTASPRYTVLSRRFEHSTLPAVDMRLLLLPEHAGQADRFFESTAAALKYYGEWFGPYPYGYITIVDPAFQSGADGMEYPTFFTGRARWIAPGEVTVPEATTAHEAGHQFWYGIVGSNEFEHAWMDEGLNTFSTARVMDQAFAHSFAERRYFGGFIPWVLRDLPLRREIDGDRLPGFRLAAEAEVQADPTYRYFPSTATFISYNKTSLWLHTLERRLGWPMLQRIMSTYFTRYKFRHPAPADFFAVVNEVSGQDLTWFFDQVYRSSNEFDYGVQNLTSVRLPGDRTSYRTTVVARRFGEAIFPVDVETTFENGDKATEQWDGVNRRAIYTYERPSRAVSVRVDPERVLLLDVNYTNNSRTLQPRAGEASLKWALKWLGWLQDVMLTHAFFV
jgi:hypothetical protein